MKKVIIYFIIGITAIIMASCSEDKLGDSIFNTNPPERNEFDQWLFKNYVEEYNIDFRYRLDDMETNMTYNLLPADVEKSRQLARIIQYFWLEAYDEVFDETGKNKDFMREYAPKVIQLIGSTAINPTNSTEILGTAEGGIKVVLYKVNSIDVTDIELLNEYYFQTMHHEFVHILHQNEDIPVEYATISAADYNSTGWQNRTDEEAWQLGFVSAYGSKEPQEDFAEMIALYLVNSEEFWNNMLEQAGEEGAAKIQQKFDMIEEWLQLSWNIDIHHLKEIIDRRAENIESILNE